jgi:eukaryotic-like serine/threonine-protein kinase
MLNPSLDDIIAQYLTDVESGEHPERERLMANHPQFADALREFFADLDQMNQVVQEKLEGTQDFTAPGIEKSQPVSKTREDEKRLNAKPSSGTKRIGNYKLLQRIGTGGMGEVWMAEQEKPVRRRVALKLIKAGMDTDQVVARFEAERQALAMMDHQNIAKVLDAGTTEDGRPFFVMELVQGISITQYCDQNKLSVSDRLNLFLPVCKAVQHAHQKGIIHRDLKPSNILVTLYDGRPVPKVIDFGLAKALQHQAKLTDKTLFTEFGQVVGTLQYMSPEQAEMNALDIDTRTDVYALGVLLYELLTGSTPIDKETLAKNAVYKVLETIRQQDPPRPSARLSSSGNAIAGISQQRQIDPRKLGEILRGDLDWIVMKALEKDRTRRYETANGFAADVQKYIEGDVVEARPPSTAYRFHKFIRKNKGLVASLITIGALLVIATFISTGFGLIASAARDAAQQSERSAIEERKAAEEARAVAQTEADRASKAEKIAEMEAESAKRSQKETEKTLARSNLLLSQSRWDEKRGVEARDLLDAIPIAHRNIEWHLLKRRYQESVSTLFGHTAWVISVAYSPDAARIVSGSADKTLKVWNAHSGIDILTIKGHLDGVTSVAFSPDGSVIASGSGDKTIKLWNGQSGVEMLTLRGHGKEVTSVAFSPDGERIASKSADATIKLWEAKSGKELLTLPVHDTDACNVVFSPDGKFIASGVGNGEISIWDTHNGLEVKSLEVNSSMVDCIAFSPDGDRIAAGGLDGVDLWDANTGTRLLRIECHDDSLTSVAFSPNGSMIATGSPDNTIKLWNSHTGAELLSFQGDDSSVTALSFSMDGSKLVSGTASGTIKQWDVLKGSEFSTLKGHESDVQSVEFSPDGRLIASASKDKRIKLWDAIGCTELITLKGHNQSVECIAFSPDGGRIASGSEDTTIKLWDMRNSAELLSLNGHSATVTCVAFRPDGAVVASGSVDRLVKFWNPNTGLELMTLSGHKGMVTSIAFSPDGNRFASGSSDKSIRLWDSQSGAELLTLKGTLAEQRTLKSYDYPARGIAFSPDGKRIASGWEHHSIQIWDAHSGEALLTLYGHKFGVNCVKFSPDGSRIATASNDDTVKLWDSHSGVELLTLQGNRNASVQSLDFSPDGTRIVFAASDDTLKLWDSVNGSEMQEFKAHKSKVTNANFSPDGKMVLSDAFDNAGKVIEAFRWDAFTLQKIDSREPWTALTPSRWSHDGRWFLNLAVNRVQVVDIDHEKSPIVQGFRKAKAGLDPWWHRDSAVTAERAKDWYAAAFHRAWQLKGQVGNAWADYKLRQAVTNLESSRTNSPTLIAEAGQDSRLLPRVVSNAISNPSGAELMLADADGIEATFRSRIGKRDKINFDVKLSDSELNLIQLAFEKHPSVDRLTLFCDTKLILGKYEEALETILSSHVKNDRVDNLLDSVQFRQMIARTIGVIRQRMIDRESDQSNFELESYINTKLLDKIALQLPNKLSARDADVISSILWDVVREAPTTSTNSPAIQFADDSGKSEGLEIVNVGIKIPSWHELLEVACQQHPEGGRLRTLGVSYYRRGEYERAIETLLRALPLNTIDDENSLILPSNAAFLALAYSKFGNSTEAQKYRVMYEQSMTIEGFDWSFKNEIAKAFGELK